MSMLKTISVHTDCVYYAHRIKDARIKELNSKKSGGYRIEKVKQDKKFTISNDYIGMPKFKKQNLEWNTLHAS